MQHLVRRLIIADLGLILADLGLMLMIFGADSNNAGPIQHGKSSVLQEWKWWQLM